MRMDRLSLQQMPGLELPLGYFLVGPWFGVAAGLLGLLAGPSLWWSRWTPAALGATHLLVLGCITMVMMGALVQVLPVLSAATVRGAGAVGVWIRWSLGVGTLSLAFALYLESRPLYYVAGPCLVGAFALYLGPLVSSLARRVGGGDSLFAIRVAVACLLVTFGLGVYLLVGHLAPELAGGFRSLTSIHLGFGLLGWITLLIMAVSFQVLPMFYVAPDYPRWLTLGLPCVMPVGIFWGHGWLLGGSCLAYALQTLWLLGRRKRRVADSTVRFWQTACVMLAVSVLIAWCWPAAELILGVAFLLGFVFTVMVGMLYKIVPFLVFLQLQKLHLGAASAGASLPTMHDVIPPRRARVQFLLHLPTIGLCLAAAAWPTVGSFAAIAVMVDAGWLAFSVRIGARSYRAGVLAFAKVSS